MFEQGQVVSYLDMCQEEGVNLQRGMNFRLRGSLSVILMSLRQGAPYLDRIEDDGKVLIYEGHDAPRIKDTPNPKTIDQPKYINDILTQNGLFYEAAIKYSKKGDNPELVKVYEKIKQGIWVFNGLFQLVNTWKEESNSRKVFKFKLELLDENISLDNKKEYVIDHNRIIPTAVKVEVWKRDKGRCVLCGSKENLHFDHIIPFSKGGSSLVSENIQLLCVRHNILKKDKIE